jgi:hypothetical protein
MSKAVLISIRPQWCDKIASGEKTIEVRKTRPKLQTPFKCYIYCTRDKHLAFMQNQTGTNLIACMDVETAIPVGGFVGNGKVIGEFVCRGFIPFCKARPCFVMEAPEEIERMACLTRKEIWKYAPEGNPIGWRISDLLIYDTPHELGEFERPYECDECNAKWASECNACHEEKKIKRAPQSWCYVEEAAEK